MKRTVWRIVKEKYADSAFTGEGAARVGGRWNSRGRWLVYTSGSLSLAALELLVHLNPPVSFRWVAIPCEFDDRIAEILPAEDLPRQWRRYPAPPATRSFGDQWLDRARSAVLAVPSAIIPREWNYLVNPAHPDIKRITIGTPEPFAFDPRLIEAGG
jgi:RES domain-containing protein